MALLFLAWAPWSGYPANAVGFLVAAYCAWLLGNALFFSPLYAAEGLYQPLMLFGAFAAAAAGTLAPARLFRAGVIVIALFVLLGLVQYFFDIGYLNERPNRASGPFMTANTQGTAVNMFLAPLAALYLTRGTAVYLGLSLWLFAGLVTTESRGAMLSLFAGLAFLALLLGRDNLRRALPRAVLMLAGFGAVWLLIVSAMQLTPLFRGAEAAGPTAATWVARATWDRTDMYGATIRLILEHPWTGSGASTFYALFETVKPDSLRDAEYRFAHSDYLQAWLEFGAPGVALLLLTVASALLLALRSCRRDSVDALPLACGAALATCFAHAMIDFPFHVAFILMLVGAFLGVLARYGVRSGQSEIQQRTERPPGPLTPTIRYALAFAALAWLSQPMLAELAVNHGVRLLTRGDARGALHWLSVAQRLEPRESSHYWDEAMIWREQATTSRNPAFAAEADAAFVRGLRANPYAIDHLVGRIRFHREHPDLLKNAATPAEILSWSKQALEMRPQHPAVRADYARSLAQAGKLDEARALARALSDAYPDSDSVKRLEREL